MIPNIARLLQARKPNASAEWMQKLPKMAKRLEGWLFRSALSFDEYSDTETLKKRLLATAIAMGMRRQPQTMCERELYFASQKGDVDAVRLCLERGVDPMGAQGSSFTPLYIACFEGHADVATLLLDHGADLLPARASPLLIACECAHVDAARVLLDRGANVDGRNDEVTPLYVACASNNVNVATLLLDRGADVEGREGESPVLSACAEGHVDAARLCLGRGAKFSRLLMDNNFFTSTAVKAWLRRMFEAGGWTCYLSEPRYQLVLTRKMAAKGWAQRKRKFSGKDPAREFRHVRLLDFLFPGEQPPPQAKQRRVQPCLPDDLFPLVIRYYWGGQP